MSPELYVEDAKAWTRALEDHEARSRGLTVPEAREVVARLCRVPIGTLETLRNRSPKAVSAHVYARLRAGVVRQLEGELTRVEHELSVLNQTGVRPPAGKLAGVLASQARLRSALGLSDGAS